MSTATPPVPAAGPAQPGLSQLARIINTFAAPRKTFADLKLNSSWWVPWALSAVFGLLFGLVAVQKIDMVRFMRQQIEQSKMAQRQMESLSPEQREQIIQRQAIVAKVTFFITPIFSLVLGLIFALIFWVAFNFGFAAENTFGRSLAIVFYSLLPGIVTAILMIVSLLVSPDNFNINNPVATNLGFFMDPQGNKFLYSIASRLDIITIWIITLMGLGFSTCSVKKLSAGTAITTVGVIYGLYALVAAGLAAAF
jgi:hypothetical protein